MKINNKLLTALPEKTRHRILSHLKLVELPLGEIVYHPGRKEKYVYFPLTTIISSIHIMGNGDATEVALTGFEGMIGISLFLDGGHVISSAVVQLSGFALRGLATDLRKEFKLAEDFHDSLLRYVQSLLIQTQIISACNRHHSLIEQFCRWLLLSHDRAQSDEIRMTQELVANMLGVRRQGVSAVAGQLQKQGFIRYSRGRIEVLDRPGLETTCCECYGVITRANRELLHDA